MLQSKDLSSPFNFVCISQFESLICIVCLGGSPSGADFWVADATWQACCIVLIVASWDILRATCSTQFTVESSGINVLSTLSGHRWRSRIVASRCRLFLCSDYRANSVFSWLFEHLLGQSVLDFSLGHLDLPHNTFVKWSALLFSLISQPGLVLDAKWIENLSLRGRIEHQVTAFETTLSDDTAVAHLLLSATSDHVRQSLLLTVLLHKSKVSLGWFSLALYSLQADRASCIRLISSWIATLWASF